MEILDGALMRINDVTHEKVLWTMTSTHTESVYETQTETFRCEEWGCNSSSMFM